MTDIDKHKQARVSCLTRACGMTVPTEMRRDVRPIWVQIRERQTFGWHDVALITDRTERLRVPS